MNKELYVTINHLDEFINASSIKVNDVLTLKKDINEKEFIDELRSRNGNLKIILTHPIINESEL